VGKYQRPSIALIEGEHHAHPYPAPHAGTLGFCEQAKDILDQLSREYWLSVSTLDIGSQEEQRLAIKV
jgi:hypothetical protein